MALPAYWPLMVAYHEVREPLYRQIIRDLGLPAATRLLDAPSGDGFYSQLFATLLGPAASIVACDVNPALLRLGCQLVPNVQRLAADLEQPALAPASFDAIWLCRSLQSVASPLALLAALVPLLRPGGRLIVVENDTAHDPILPWPAEFEHRLRAARLAYERQCCVAPADCERYKAAMRLAHWLRQLNLVDLSVHTYVSEDLAPLTPPLEAYWQRFLAWYAGELEPFLSAADNAALRASFDPQSPDYLLAQPGCYCLELTTVAVGRVPGAWRPPPPPPNPIPPATEFGQS